MSNKPAADMDKRLERQVIVIFYLLIAVIVAVVVAAFIYIPTVVGIIYASTLGLFLLLALLSGALIVSKWIWHELSQLTRLEQPGPKRIWLQRGETLKEATKVTD